MTCEHLKEGSICNIASLLASTKVATTEQACNICKSYPVNAMTVNHVTCSIAATHLISTATVSNVVGDLLRCAGTPIDKGPGTELKKSLKWFGKPNSTCGCETKASVMDAWGCDICLERIDIIIGWLVEAALKEIGIVPPIIVLRWLVKRAIKRARNV